MATSVLEQTGGRSAISSSPLARYLALEATVPVVLFASAAIITGLHWDIAWHRSVGRDTFWTPPHVLEQIAAAMAGLFCGWRVLYTSFWGTDADRGNAVKFWGLFYGPLGGWVCIWGTIAMISSAPFDDWWHAAYGLDVKILTPPHVFLLLGMITIQLGAMLMMLAEQNRTEATTRRGGLTFSISMGLIVLMVTTIFYSETGVANLQHRPVFFTVMAAAVPLFLAAVSLAGRSKWPATTAAMTYSLVLIVLNWILALIPATPKLAPIYNQLTHLVPPGFPILLVAPALAIDWILARRRERSDWVSAPLLGVAFLVILALVQWPFASFMLTLKQPNYLMGFGYWDYGSRLGEWQKHFIDVPGYSWVRGKGPVGALDLAVMAKAFLFAMLLGTVSSRLGLAWGRWMTRVRR